LENKNYLALEVKYSDGDMQTLFVDPDNYLTQIVEYKDTIQQREGPKALCYLSDFKIIDNIAVPFLRTTKDLTTKVISITHNIGLKDDIFTIPK
jgi:hypothetical protein